MKKIYILGILFLLSGCIKSKQGVLIGTFETTYELGAFGKVIERYQFKEDGRCIRTLKAGNDITRTCTYEIKKDKIKIVWNDKLDKEHFDTYKKIDKNTVMIGNYKYKRKK